MYCEFKAARSVHKAGKIPKKVIVSQTLVSLSGLA